LPSVFHTTNVGVAQTHSPSIATHNKHANKMHGYISNTPAFKALTRVMYSFAGLIPVGAESTHSDVKALTHIQSKEVLQIKIWLL